MKTSLISHRACHLAGTKNEDINRFVEEIKFFLEEAKIPENCAVDVYKDQVTCCGVFPIGVAIEIEGPKKQAIEDLDLKIFAKIIEICEREGIEHHECEPLEILETGE